MNFAVLLSGGTGTRIASDVPKQYLSVGGHMIVTEALRRLYVHSGIHAVQIVAQEDWRERILADWRAVGDAAASEDKPIGFSSPGENRQLSILNGLRDLRARASADSLVLIHDAARPLVRAATIAACLAACREHDGAMPVLPMKDTVYYSEDGVRVERLLERERIYAGQAPEAFRYGAYLTATEALFPDRIRAIRGSSEPAVMAGMDIALLPGDEGNFKITTPRDLERYRELTERAAK